MSKSVGSSIVALALAELHPHPKNPRKPGGGNLAGLAESLKAQGQLEPILVRELEAGGFEILAGHRRVEALRLIGRETADAVVRRDLGDGDALAILLAANDQREDVDAFLEALALRELVIFEGSVKGAAARLGQTSRWVAQRLALLELSPSWQKRRKEAPWDAWTPAHWQQIARLAPDAQEALASEKGRDVYLLEQESPAVDDLEAMVNERLRVLGRAPFDVEDSKLCRGTPACSACPKTSQSVPGLFDDGEPTDLKAATCRDAYCWGRKAAATVRAKIAAAKEKAAPEPGAEVLVVGRGASAPKGAGRVVPSYSWEPSKEGAKGAVPVVIVGEGGAVTTGYAKVKGGAESGARAAGHQPKLATAEKPADRLARLETQHAEAIADDVERSIWDRIEKHPAPMPFRRALALVLLVGAYPFPRRGARKSPLEAGLKLAEALGRGEAFDEATVAEALRPAIALQSEDVAYEFAQCYSDAGGEALVRRALQALAAAAGVTPAELAAVAAKVKPSPELLAARAAVAAAPPAKAAPSKKGRGKAAAAGDDDAGDADAAPAPSGKAKRAGKGAR